MGARSKIQPLSTDVDFLEVGRMVTLVDKRTGSVYYGRVLVQRGVAGSTVAPYTKDGVRIAKRAIQVTGESHTLLEEE